MKVSEIMSARPVTVGQNEPAAHAARRDTRLMKVAAHTKKQVICAL